MRSDGLLCGVTPPSMNTPGSSPSTMEIVSGFGLPVEGARIVGEDPRAAGIDPLADHAQPGDELLAAQREIPHNLLDFAAQHASIILGLQPQDAPEWTLEH